MKPLIPSRGGLVIGIPVAAALFSPLSAATLTWDNSSADSLWTTAANWDTGFRPGADDDTIFPAGLGGTIVLDSVPISPGTYFPTARSIQFNDNHTINGGSFIGAPLGLEVGVGGGSLVTFNAAITPNGVLTKSGAGTLVVATSLGTATGLIVNGGVLRANLSRALGNTDDVTTVNSGATLELNNFHHAQRITLNDGATLKGLGAASTNFSTNSLVISNTATAVSIGAPGSSDVLRTDNMAGGSTSTVMTMTGDGTLRLNSNNAFLASWVIPSGKVSIIGTLENLGQHTAGSVTLSGGTLGVELAPSPGNYTGGPGNNIFVTANSGLFNDRQGTAGSGQPATFGNMTMGAQTLSVAAGSLATGGDPGFYFGNLTLTGDPTFSITQGNNGRGHFAAYSLNGGGVPRAITKTGPGSLSFYSSGTNELATGSTLTASGGGNLVLSFPFIGPDPTTPVSMANNPIGNADVSMTDGTLMLRGHGSAAIYELPNHLTLGGTVVVDPDRNVSGYVSDVFRMASITLKPGTVMGISGDSNFAIGSLGPMVLEGNATLQGFDSGTIADGECFLYGGISGGPASALTIGNNIRPINLTIAAASTYGGGTVVNGGNTTLTASAAFGTGPTTLNGGNLALNVDGTLTGTVTINGGTLIAKGLNTLASNPIVLNGGLLDLRNNADAAINLPSLTVSGTSALNFSRVSSGSPLLTIPVVDVSGNTTLSVTNGTQATNLISGFDLAGDLTLNATSTTRVTSITEDGTPRKFIKTGNSQLDLEGASSHSGGTEVLAGVLYVQHAAALGSGPLTIGATSGTAAATARFQENLTIPNDIVVRSGSSGAMTLDAETGRVTWNGTVDLQKSLVLDNGSSTAIDLSYVNGVVSGIGDITKVGGGEIVLASAANTFGSGTPTSVTINGGTLTVASDSALGNASNGVNLLSGTLKVTSTFSTPRTFTVTGTGTSVNVTTGNTLTMTTPVTGTGTFAKGDAGTLVIAPSVDATARGAAITASNGGIVRVQGLKNLGDASPIAADNGGTFEFAMDADTNFAHPLTLNGTGGIIVDRAVSGSGTNGRHTIGAVNIPSTSGGSLIVSGSNGYGLSATSFTTPANSSFYNNAPGTFILGSLTGNPNTASRTLTTGGSGDIQITGATSVGAGSGTFGIVKTGAGKFTFGTSLAGFGRVLTVNDGTFDLNGNAYTSAQVVTMGGAASALGAKIETGAAGSLNLGAGLTFSNANTPPGAMITGNVGIGSLAQAFTINPASGTAPALTINGPISGSAGSSITKSGSGTLRLSGAGNTLPGLVSVSAGVLQLGKSSGDAIGTGGLATSGVSTVRLTAGEQINNNASISLGAADESFLELANFTETVGPLTITQTDANDYSAVKTGPTGILVLNGNLSLNNNANSSATDGREVLITGSGGETTPTTDGFLDLGGVNRTIQVSTTTVGTNEPRANATIETQILNGGIVKTGTRTLYLTNPNNTFAGGLQIAGGTVRSGGGSSLGLGPITFTNALGVAAGIDFGTLTGTVADHFDLNGAGDVTFTYSGLAPNTLTLSGNFDTTQNLIFDVVNGTTAQGDTATLDLTGVIDDAASIIGLTKVGNGTLKLDAGNTYSGDTTVQKGMLSIAANSALGDSATDLVIDGGCLLTTASFTLGRDLVFGANGGSVRGNAATTLDLPSLEWGAGISAFFGSGTTILSGTTTGTGGHLQLGTPTAFAPGTNTLLVGSGHVLSLRGTAALPPGNLNFENKAVLELGNGDFTRQLGNLSGQVQLATAVGGGWAAHGANRIVNLGGAGATLVWGQSSPAFLFRNVTGNDFGALILGSATGTHTVDFQNALELDNSAFPSSPSRQIITNNGPASLDAKISGDIRLSDPLESGYLALTTAGSLEISGDITGYTFVEHDGPGTTILSGANQMGPGLIITAGTVVLANDASAGIPAEIRIDAGAHLDASAMTVPLAGGPLCTFNVQGTLTGDVASAYSFVGNGIVTGDLAAAPASYVSPHLGGPLHIGGDFTLDAGAELDIEISGNVPTVSTTQLRVTGAVNLAGILYPYGSFNVALGNSVIVLLNDGSDPINGTFAGLDEGDGIPIGNGLALQVTYLANGDGGPIGNDVGVTVVADTFSTDLAVTVDAPLAVDLGAAFTITYTVQNLGPVDSTGGSMEIPLPLNATFNSSTPAGTVDSGTLTIPVPALALDATTVITLQFTAPGTEAAILVEPAITANGIDGDTGNNSAPSVTAVMAGGELVLSVFNVDEENDELTLGIDTIEGVSYVLQTSIDLDGWNDYWYFEGDGFPAEFNFSMDEPREFFRFKIEPYDGGGGGAGE